MSKPWLNDPTTLLKRELRKKMAETLATVSNSDVAEQSKKVHEKVFNAQWFKEAQRISVFVNTAGEVETDAVIRMCLNEGKALFIPMFVKGVKKMEMLRVPSLAAYEKMGASLWGIKQPNVEDNWEPYEKTGALEVVIMPGVAFTRNGDRLGHGMGFYDRFLAGHLEQFGKMPRTVALSLQQQIVDTVPLAKTDVHVDDVMVA